MSLYGDLLFASSKSPTIGPREDYEVNLLEGEGRRNEGFIESSPRYLKVEYHILNLNLVNLFYLFLFSLFFWGKYREMTFTFCQQHYEENDQICFYDDSVRVLVNGR